MSERVPLPVRIVVATLTVAAAALLLALAPLTVRVAQTLPPLTLAWAGVFVVAYYVLERKGITFQWRQHRVMTSFSESEARSVMADTAGTSRRPLNLSRPSVSLIPG